MEQNRRKKIGFVVGNYHSDHPSRLVRNISELLKDEDVDLRVFLGTESSSFMKDFVLRSNLFDYQYASLCGYSRYEDLDLLIISAGTLSIYQNSIPLEVFLRHVPDIPLILMETDYTPENGISMIADNAQGIADCTEHLITVHGKRKIGFITGPDNNKDAEERYAGYARILEKYNIPIEEKRIVHGDYSEHVDRAVEQLLDRNPDLEAIVSSNDEMAVAIYRVCGQRGLKIGKDIAVTGFDDMLMAGNMNPPLTTARQDYEAFAAYAVEQAKAILCGEKAHSTRIHAPFIRRCSCGCEEAPSEKNEAEENREDILTAFNKNRDYQHNSWIGSLLIRELLLEVEEPRRFFETIGFALSYLGTKSSYLCIFDHPLSVKRGTIPELPEKIRVRMRQEGKHYTGYDDKHAPVLRLGQGGDDVSWPGNYMSFLLFDERFQYGVLNVQISPEEIDFYYMLSLEIGTSMRYMELWQQEEHYREELQALALHDDLTGLYNRTGIMGQARTLLKRKKSRIAVILADLDHLKQINDTFGHQEGDDALRISSQLLCRVFGPGDLVGRVGGDEFLVFCRLKRGETAEEKVEKLRRICAEFNELSGKPYYVEISAGCYSLPENTGEEELTQILSQADENLYEAKKNRRPFVIREVGREQTDAET